MSVFALITVLAISWVIPASQVKPPTKDEVYFSIARRDNKESDSPVSGIVNALDEVIEVGEIALTNDGKAMVMVSEKAPSTASVQKKSAHLIFARVGDKWEWEQFEDNRRFYPNDKLFPYAKDQIEKQRQLLAARWAVYVENMSRPGDAAVRVLETAKAVLQGDPPPAAALASARNAFAVSRAKSDNDAIISANKDLVRAIEPVLTLSDNYEVLKTNDAYLRLVDELKVTQANVLASRKEYLSTLEKYNDLIQRLPFALVAFSQGFTRIEPLVDDN
jgi:hypothetical protein